jgi:hypothetical protein
MVSSLVLLAIAVVVLVAVVVVVVVVTAFGVTAEAGLVVLLEILPE